MRAFGSFNAQVDFGSIIPELKGLKYRLNFGPDLSYYRDGIYYCSVVTTVNSNTAAANSQWGALYTAIGDANLLIQNARNSTCTSADIKSTSLGEGLFMRGYSYLRLVSQYGRVPLVTSPSTSVSLEFTRVSAQDVFSQIIIDLDSAYNLLSYSGGPYHITKDVKGSASHAYFLMAGSTDPMQSRLVNGKIIIHYTDGSADSLLLKNPDT